MSKTVWDYAADFLDPPDISWRPQEHQLPPPGLWFGWLFLGGRGTGKTATDAKYVWDHVNGPPCDPKLPGGHWLSIIAPTKDDAVTSCVNGPSGLKQHDPGLKLRVGAGGTTVKFSTGAEGKLFGASTPEDVERLRSGGNRCLAWLEELAAWRYMNECYQHMRYGLRLGPRPHWIASTTPKPHLLIRYLVYRSRIDAGETLSKSDIQKYKEICSKLNQPFDLAPSPERQKILRTSGTTEDNKKLPQHIKDMLYQDYAGTRVGRQELLAEILDDVEGALWNYDDIDLWRIPVSDTPAHFDKIIISVDPPATSKGDEAGIIVAGVVRKLKLDRIAGMPVPFPDLPHAFILADYSIQGGPSAWAKNVIGAFDDWGANGVVAEINNGGEMVKHTLHTVRPSLPVKVVHATRGKAIRAEPVANIYQQGRAHHVGVFPKLEDQMTTWDADDPPEDWSPDRMDSLVWNLTELMVGVSMVTVTKSRDNRLAGRR